MRWRARSKPLRLARLYRDHGRREELPGGCRRVLRAEPEPGANLGWRCRHVADDEESRCRRGGAEFGRAREAVLIELGELARLRGDNVAVLVVHGRAALYADDGLAGAIADAELEQDILVCDRQSRYGGMPTNRMASVCSTTTSGSGSGALSVCPEIGRTSYRANGGTFGLSKRMSNMVWLCAWVSGGQVGASLVATTFPWSS